MSEEADAEIKEKAEELIEEGKRPAPESGHDRLWRWWGLSYASFLVLPRVLMHEMPDEWQDDMAQLLEEYRDTFKGVKGLRSTVRFRGRDGRFVSAPDWLADYRHPDRGTIEDMRRNGAEPARDDSST